MNSKILRDIVIFLAIVSLASDCKEAEELEVDGSIYASFTVEPMIGSVNTIFTFDASESFYRTDQGTTSSTVNCNWDFDYTGIEDIFWDTEESYEDIATHVYTEAKIYRVLLNVNKDGDHDTISKLVLVTEATNTPPYPIFSISPEQAYPHEIFDFNAMQSCDNEDPQESLQLRWDYETDYIFEEDWDLYENVVITGHFYDAPGEYKATLHVKDTEGAVDSISHTLTVIDYIYDIPCPDDPTVVYQGIEYYTVYIVDQCWLAENLNVGERLDYYVNSTNNGQIEKYCYHNLQAKCNQYGGMYQWDEMMNYTTDEGTQGICPPDWHIPTSNDISKLRTNLNYFGTYINPNFSETNVGKQIQHPNNNCEGLCQDLGQSGFDFLLGGITPDLLVNTEGEEAQFWTSSETNTINARSLRVLFDFHLWHTAGPGTSKTLPAYVRCIKNE